MVVRSHTVSQHLGGSCLRQRTKSVRLFAVHTRHAWAETRRNFQRGLDRRCDCGASASVTDTDSELVYDEPTGSPAAIRKYLTSIGWESAWIDGVTERIMKRQLSTTTETCQSAVEYLLSLGLTEQQICNMVSLCPNILANDAETRLKPVVEFLTKKGVHYMRPVLAMNPKLLDYELTADGKYLQKAQLRAAVEVEQKGSDKEAVNIILFREGAAFNTAPLTPWKPSDL